MEPYRPLFVTTEPAHERIPRARRGLGVVLLALGVLRLLPALAAREAMSLEPVAAVLMIVIGLALVGDARARLRRLRRRRACLLVACASAAASLRPAAADDDTARITASGYIETYYQLNLRLPDDRVTALRGFDNRDRTFTISNVALGMTGERGPLSTKLVLQVGSTGAIYYAAEPPDGGGPELWRYLQQATFAYTTADKIVVDAGLFPSPVGPEVIPVKDNWNWSRSDLFFGLPFYHTGARVAVPLGGGWTGQAHVYSGWNTVVDNNPYPSAALSAAYAGKRVQGQLLYFGGSERASGAVESKPWRHLFDAYATVVLTDRASMLVHADAGVEPNNVGTSAWAAAALYGKVDLSGCLYAAARADVFREWVPDGASAIFWPTSYVGSGTATLAWQPVTGISARFEYRHDHAPGGAYGGHHTQNTLTLGATAWF